MPENVYNFVYIASAVVLVVALVGVEMYRHRKGTSGTITKLLSVDPGFGMGSGEALIRLDRGKEVSAEIPGCVQCMGKFREGDKVLVTKLGNKYVVGLGTGFKAANANCDTTDSKPDCHIQ